MHEYIYILNAWNEKKGVEGERNPTCYHTVRTTRRNQTEAGATLG
jgi:hypothetical protein